MTPGHPTSFFCSSRTHYTGKSIPWVSAGLPSTSSPAVRWPVKSHRYVLEVVLVVTTQVGARSNTSSQIKDSLGVWREDRRVVTTGPSEGGTTLRLTEVRDVVRTPTGVSGPWTVCSGSEKVSSNKVVTSPSWTRVEQTGLSSTRDFTLFHPLWLSRNSGWVP